MRQVVASCIAVVLLGIATGSAQAQDKAIGRVRVGTGPWSSIYSNNRSPEGACTFNALTVIKSLDGASPTLFEGVSSNEPAEPVELEVRDEKKSLTIVYRLDGVTITDTRTLAGGKGRVTLRYKKCAVKERKAS